MKPLRRFRARLAAARFYGELVAGLPLLFAHPPLEPPFRLLRVGGGQQHWAPLPLGGVCGVAPLSSPLMPLSPNVFLLHWQQQLLLPAELGSLRRLASAPALLPAPLLLHRLFWRWLLLPLLAPFLCRHGHP